MLRAWVAMPLRASAQRQQQWGQRAFASVAAGFNETSWEYDHDVIVVGGGIVGCTLACRLAQDTAIATSTTNNNKNNDDKNKNNLNSAPSVCLIEARPPASLEAALSRDSPDPRVYSLTPASARLLQKIGVWDCSRGGSIVAGVRDGALGVIKERSQPFGGMQVWDDRGPGHLRFGGEGEDAAASGNNLGFISEHGVIHSSLFERVRQLENAGLAGLMCGAQVKRVRFPAKGAGGATGPMTVMVQTEDGQTKELTCRLLVAADGGDSKTAKMLGLTSWGWGYGQRAVVATVRLSESHGQTAFQRYLPRGPLAMLPLRGDKASLVWSTTPEHAEQLKSLTEAEFIQEVNDALRRPAGSGEYSSERSEFSASGDPASAASSSSSSPSCASFGSRGTGQPSDTLLGNLPKAVSLPFPNPIALANPLAVAAAVGDAVVKGAEGLAGALAGLSLGLGAAEGGGFSTPPEAVELMTPRLGFDLSLRQAHNYTGERAALVGDAAHTIHPMAGQGLNLGMADADALARAVLAGRQSGTDVGSTVLLGQYEKERKMDAFVMMGALDSLHRLFGADSRAVAAARSAGLSALNAAGPVKRRLALHAMGGGGV